MKIVNILAGLFALTALSGCMTGAVILTAGEAIKLNPEPDRYFKLTADVGGLSGARKIEFGWVCEHVRILSMGTGSWQLRWKYKNDALVIRQIDGNEVALFRLPAYRFCDIKDPVPFASGVAVTGVGTDDPVRVNENVNASRLTVRGVMERLPEPFTNPKQSPAEQAVRSRISARLPGFKALTVSVWPEGTWEGASAYSDYAATMSTSGTIPWNLCDAKADKSACELGQPAYKVHLRPNDAIAIAPADGQNEAGTYATFYKANLTKKYPSLCVGTDCIDLYSDSRLRYFENSKTIVRFYYRDFHPSVHIPQ